MNIICYGACTSIDKVCHKACKTCRLVEKVCEWPCVKGRTQSTKTNFTESKMSQKRSISHVTTQLHWKQSGLGPAGVYKFKDNLLKSPYCSQTSCAGWMDLSAYALIDYQLTTLDPKVERGPIWVAELTMCWHGGGKFWGKPISQGCRMLEQGGLWVFSGPHRGGGLCSMAMKTVWGCTDCPLDPGGQTLGSCNSTC